MKQLQATELSKLLNVSGRTILSWQRAGLKPSGSIRTASGRSANVWTVEGVRDWLVSHDRPELAVKLAMPPTTRSKGTVPGQPEPTVPLTPDGKPDVQAFDGQLRRTRELEKHFHRTWKAAEKKGDAVAASVASKLYLQTTEILARMEKSKADILLADNSMISVDKAGEIFDSIHVLIRARLDTMPNSLPPELENKSAPEIFAILRRWKNETLSHLHDNILAGAARDAGQ